MQLLPLLIFIAIAIINGKRNQAKKTEQARRRAASVQQAERGDSVPAMAADRPAYRPTAPRRQQPLQARPRTAPAPAQRSAASPAPAVAPTPVQPLQGSLVFDSHEGDASLEGVATSTPKPQHVVQPLTESKHAHMESSMTGFETCPTDPADAVLPSHEGAYDIRTSVHAAIPRLNAANIRQAVIFSELLGKPKALRR